MKTEKNIFCFGLGEKIPHQCYCVQISFIRISRYVFATTKHIYRFPPGLCFNFVLTPMPSCTLPPRPHPAQHNACQPVLNPLHPTPRYPTPLHIFSQGFPLFTSCSSLNTPPLPPLNPPSVSHNLPCIYPKEGSDILAQIHQRVLAA